MIVREIESEMAALESFAETQNELELKMARKVAMERVFSLRRLELQRRRAGHSSTTDDTREELQAEMAELRVRLDTLDAEIGPLARRSGQLVNERWGLLMRTGSDKSHLARQIEGHADIYTSRVSNFFFETPFAYFRSHRGTLPHDQAAGARPEV